jgi:hypothetical protein
MVRRILNVVKSLNPIKYLPLLGSLSFLVSFIYLHRKYCTRNADGIIYIHEPSEMLHWLDFFTTDAYFFLIGSICFSFFIKNKRLKWTSIVIAAGTFYLIGKYVGDFNPLWDASNFCLITLIIAKENNFTYMFSAKVRIQSSRHRLKRE